jgi:hypothetical protein
MQQWPWEQLMQIAKALGILGFLSMAFWPTPPSSARETCQSVIGELNRVADQITDARKKAVHEDECHAEAAAWAKAAALFERRIALREQAEAICGNDLQDGIPVDKLRASLKQMRKFEATSKQDCEEDASALQKPASNDSDFNVELIPSGRIGCFGGGTCTSDKASGPTTSNGSPSRPAPRTRPSTITGKQFGDKDSASSGSGLAVPAK